MFLQRKSTLGSKRLVMNVAPLIKKWVTLEIKNAFPGQRQADNVEMWFGLHPCRWTISSESDSLKSR